MTQGSGSISSTKTLERQAITQTEKKERKREKERMKRIKEARKEEERRKEKGREKESNFAFTEQYMNFMNLLFVFILFVDKMYARAFVLSVKSAKRIV